MCDLIRFPLQLYKKIPVVQALQLKTNVGLAGHMDIYSMLIHASKVSLVPTVHVANSAIKNPIKNIPLVSKTIIIIYSQTLCKG